MMLLPSLSLVNYAARGSLQWVVGVVEPKNKIARTPLNAHIFHLAFCAQAFEALTRFSFGKFWLN